MVGPAPHQHRMLVVEGNDDEHVVRHLHDRLGLGLSFGIRQAGDIGALINSIRVEVVVSGRSAIGFVADADADVRRRWQAITGKLEARGISAPTLLEARGTIIEQQDQPVIGVWLMPDNRAKGELEDFVAAMVPGGDPVWPMTRNYIINAEPYLETRYSKAEIRAWLATRERPLMGGSIGTGALSTDGPLCRSFAAWLKRLFG